MEIEEYKKYLLLKKHFKPRTIEGRIALVNNLLKHCPTLTEEHLNNYLYSLKEKDKKSTYLNLLIATAKSYNEYLKEQGEPYDRKMLTIKQFRIETPIKAIFTDNEIEIFLAYPFRNLAWSVFWHLLAFTGARPIEIALLEARHIQFSSNSILIEHSKTYTPRTIPIPPNVLPMLKDLLKITSEGRLFPKANEKTWGFHFRNIIRKVEIEKRIGLTCYSFRHSYITALIKGDISLFKIKKLVGHKNLASTEAYCHLTSEDVQTSILAHPLISKYAEPKLILDAIKKVIESYKDNTSNTLLYKTKETNKAFYCEIKVKSKRSPTL